MGTVESAYEYWHRHEARRAVVYVVDAFTKEAFSGNPAGVCLLEDEATPDAGWMQRVAAEMNLSETAFVQRRMGSAKWEFELRWFTPAIEVNLCGHATLATAHALWWNEVVPAGQPITFHTRSGPLTCVQADEGWIEMDFPATPASVVVEGEARSELAGALGVSVRHAARTREMVLVELLDERAVREVLPDMAALRKIDAVGVIVTAKAASKQSEYDVVTRFFAPRAGIDEDPVTGSAHCVLGPYWFEKLGTDELVSYQASARGGTVRVSRGEAGRLTLAGQAVSVMRAELSV